MEELEIMLVEEIDAHIKTKNQMGKLLSVVNELLETEQLEGSTNYSFFINRFKELIEEQNQE